MKRERTYIIITLGLTVVVNIVGLFLGKSWNTFIYFLFPILFVLLMYFLIVSQMINMQAELSEKIKSISKGYEFVSGEDFVKRNLVETIKKAEEFIFTTGGRAREVDYLQCLTQKVINENIKYYRVILGDHIQHSFHEHLKEIIDKKVDSAYIGHQIEEKYGNMLITDEEIILYLPSPSFKSLDTILKIDDPNLAKKYQLYIMQIYSESKKITSDTELKDLCIKCRS